MDMAAVTEQTTVDFEGIAAEELLCLFFATWLHIVELKYFERSWLTHVIRKNSTNVHF